MKPFSKEEMKKAMALYAVTDSTWLGKRQLEEVVEETIEAGATFIQFREKKLSSNDFITLAKKIKNVTDEKQIPFVINDEVEIAKLIDADGVHIGQNDKNLLEARKILGKDKIIGVSAHSVEEALKAEKNGADYLGVGSVFVTATKKDASAISFETVREICKSVAIPVVVIGGIQKDNILDLKGLGMDGVAVISAIFAQEDIKHATKELYALSQEIVKRKMR